MYCASDNFSFQTASLAHDAARCDACPARQSAICAVLGAPEITEFSALGRIEKLRRSETFFWEGDEAASIATVRSGVFKLTASLADGREQIVGLALPGDVIGRPYGKRVEYCATALGDAELCVMRRETFEQFIETHPAMMRALLGRVLGDLDRTQTRILMLGRKTARERVCSLLAELASAEGSLADGCEFNLPLKRQAMADLLGLTIETVSRQITALAEQGVIALPSLRCLRIVDRARLMAAAG